MARMFVASILSGFLSACSGMPEWALVIPSRNHQVVDPVSHYSFEWRLSGDRAVAPVQVFDNGQKTWLQFLPQQPLPAVFEHTATGDRPLTYTQEGPYMVLNGVWPKLALRGGRLQSRVERLHEPAAEPPAAVVPADLPAALSVASPAISSEMPVDISTVTTAATPTTTPTITPPITLPVAGMPDESTQRYDVSPKDLNLRSALSRWAQSVGWTFEPEHWAVDADIPIVASATFEPGFRLAVQDLVASTELADRPLRPCFYSNRVLRIVPYAQQCNRTVAGAGTS
ncbi:hypothetical protein CR159_14210 [Pollutimonas subterranea]|uniref:Toxin co-regulated pilus biosynthesis protein Q C-terminal domain-containing protein n=1 Tax=Pollutimonas subterranea TaxID=2045210 RepID=A0A2N4U2C9_9BURK|nr:TcpQ domain-containing protein [Pollutimonas subterranea]PLC49169.1 hypothetical protein CR159_14210 [Pollutimonas subterranea]